MTSYLGTSNSSQATLDRSKGLADVIGAQHFNLDIEEATKSIENVFTKATGKTPKYVAHGGTYTEDLALQNI